ncbi:hypothetical protein Tco_1089495 [Tanacetum coccineum]
MAVTFRDRYEVQMIMRFNEIHKFGDGTLHQIDRHWTTESRNSSTQDEDGNPSRANVKQALDLNPLAHSFCDLSTLRRSGLKTASTAAKPYQGDSSEFYLITGIPTVAAAGQRHVNSLRHAHISYS